MASLLCFALAILALQVVSAYEDCPPDYPGDGYCDAECNIPQFAYDRGDCCESNCTSAEYECGYNGYDCRFLLPTDCLASDLGDGWCDTACNRGELLYDLGDCCAGDCTSGPYWCGINGYDCKFQYAGSGCLIGYPADGYCDYGCNVEGTLYDLGDCCVSTCTSAEYTCTESNADCISLQTVGCPLDYPADGYCDPSCNNNIAIWDKQDCCEETCKDSNYTCGSNGYYCLQVSGIETVGATGAKISDKKLSAPNTKTNAKLGAKVGLPQQKPGAKFAWPQQKPGAKIAWPQQKPIAKIGLPQQKPGVKQMSARSSSNEKPPPPGKIEKKNTAEALKNTLRKQ